MSEITLNIGGKRVKVGADFLNLSPEQQQATVDEIAGTLGPANPEAAAISQDYQQAITPQDSTYGGQLAGSTARGAMNAIDMAPRGPIEMLTDTLGITEAGAERDRYRPAADQAVENLVGEKFDPRYYWTNAFGENLGAGMVAAPLQVASRVKAGAGLLNAGLREGGSQVAGAVGSTVGAQAGGELAAQTLGEDYRAGGAFFGSVAGGAGANLAPEAAARSTRRMFGRSETGRPAREIGEAMERQGITPTPGVVGGKFLSGTENLTDQLPVIGTYRRTDQQYDEFGRALQAGAAKVRGANQPIGAQNTPQLGERVREIASNTVTRRTKEVGDAEEAIRAKIGGNTPVDVSKIRVKIRDLANGQIGETKRLLQSYDKLLRQKGGVTYDQLQSLRTQVGQAVKSGNLEGGLRKQIYAAIEQSQFEAAQSIPRFTARGPQATRQKLGDELRQTKEMTRRSENWDDSPQDGGGDLAYMRSLADKERASSIFTEIFGGSGRLDQRGIEGLSYLHSADPQAASAVTAEVIEMMGRTKPGNTGIDRVWSPNNFATFWDRLDPQAKTIMTNRNPEAIAIFDDLSLIGKAFRSKESMANRSNSFNLQMAAGLISWSLGNLPGVAAQGAVMRGMTSKKMAQLLIREDPTTARLLARYGSSSVARSLNELYNQSYNSETTE